MIDLEVFGDTVQNDRKARSHISHTHRKQVGNVYGFPSESTKEYSECIEGATNLHVIRNANESEEFDDLEDQGTCIANQKDDGLYMKLNKNTMEPHTG